MANDNPSSNLERAAEAAEDFEKKHYQGGELDAQDFKKAGENVTAAVSDAATAVKEAVVGPADPKADPATAPTADTSTAASNAPLVAADKPDTATAADGPSVLTQLQDKTAGALASLQQAVEPKPGNKSADPEVNEFRSLVAEVFDNMKGSIASGDSAESDPAQQGNLGGALPAEAGAAADAAQHKALASSPAEARSVLGQLMDKILPVAEAEGRSAGESHIGEGTSKGLIQDLAENVETAVEEVTGHHHGRPAASDDGRSRGQKWEDAKGEAQNAGQEAKASIRDAAGALGDETRRGANRAEHETSRFFNRTGEAAAGTAERGADLTRDAKDRVKRDWPGAEVRGVVEETKDLTRNAADRVKEDWQRTKEGTQNMLDNSDSARQWRADHAPAPKKERGFFGGITHALFGSDDGEDLDAKARNAADRTRSNARSAADDISDKAHEAKENTKSFFNQAGDEASRQADRAEDKTRGFFGRASDETRRTADQAEDKTRGFFGRASDETRRTADRAEDKTRGFFGRASDETRRSADSAEDSARGFWNRTKDDADRLGDKAEAKFNRWGDRINDSVEDTKRAVQDKWNRAEDYLEADLRPRSSGDAAAQAGYIPSNTQDVLASRGGRRY